MHQDEKNALTISSRRRKPDFFIAGAPKAGTTSLYFYLIQHPAVFMPEPKEPHFFYNEASPGSPVLEEKDLEEYLELFRGVPESVQAGEASTSYLYLENAPREIKRLQNSAKIILVLRDPVDRAYSQYWNQVRDGSEPLSFEEALESEPARRKRNWWHGFYYLETGRYAEQVARYLETFGRDNVLIHLFEDLSQDIERVCQDTFAFLGVDVDQQINVTKSYNRGGPARSMLLSRLLNSPAIKAPVKKVVPTASRRTLGNRLRAANTKAVPEMNPEIRGELKRAFENDILELEELLGRELSHWRQ